MSSDSYHNLARKYGSHILQRHLHYLQRQTIIVLHDNIICFVVLVAVEVPTGIQVSSDKAVSITSLKTDFLIFYYPLPSQIYTRRCWCCTKMGCWKHCISYWPTVLPLLVRNFPVCFVTLTSYASYSLKTSKVTYLDEAFQFYSAVKTRGYYKMADKYASSVYSILLETFAHYSKERMVKQLRYYTRFIVVCLLLDKKSKVQELIQVNILIPIGHLRGHRRRNQ